MRKYLSLLLLPLLLLGCSTQNKFNKIASKHPDWLAEQCAAVYPQSQSATETKTEYVAANNTNYQGKIDSLAAVVDFLRNNGEKEYTAAPDNCKPALAKQNKQIKDLAAALQHWQKMYNECIPDTLKVTNTIKVLDSAKLFLLNKKIKDQGEEIAVLTDQRDTARTQRNWLIGATLILGGFAALKLMGKI